MDYEQLPGTIFEWKIENNELKFKLIEGQDGTGMNIGSSEDPTSIVYFNDHSPWNGYKNIITKITLCSPIFAKLENGAGFSNYPNLKSIVVSPYNYFTEDLNQTDEDVIDVYNYNEGHIENVFKNSPNLTGGFVYHGTKHITQRYDENKINGDMMTFPKGYLTVNFDECEPDKIPTNFVSKGCLQRIATAIREYEDSYNLISAKDLPIRLGAIFQKTRIEDSNKLHFVTVCEGNKKYTLAIPKDKLELVKLPEGQWQDDYGNIIYSLNINVKVLNKVMESEVQE